MSMHQFGCGIGTLSILASLCTGTASATLILSPELTAQDVNALVALEATQYGLAATAFSVNQSVSAQPLGTWSGTIDSSGWNLTFSGQLNGTGMSIVESGQLDLTNNQATWTDTGMFGSAAITGSGNVMLDPFWKTFWKVVAGVTIVGAQTLTTVGSAGTTAVLDKFLSVGSATIINGLIDDAFQTQSTVQKSPGTTASLLGSSAMTSSSSSLQVAMVQFGTLDQATGSAEFSSTATPEPASLGLLGVGFGLFIGLSLARRARSRAL